MTTPGQPAPDGAYIIGGSGNAYGQEMTDASAAHLMLGGFTSIASIANPLDAVGAAMNMFAQSLLKLPLDVLKLFEPLIPGDLGDVFGTVGGAVNAIMGFFQQIGPLLTSTFNSFITTTYNVLSSGFQQILDIVNGLVVVPISSAVSGFKDWFTGLMGSTIPDLGTAISGAVNDVSDLIHDLLTAPASVLGNIPQTLVSGLGTALSDVNGFVQGVVNAIIQAISGIPFVGGSISAALAALTGAVQVQQANQQAAVVTVATANLGANELWKAPYDIADVAYPKIFHSAMQIQGITTATTAGGTSHTHDVFGTSGVSSGNLAIVPLTSYASGSSRGSFVKTRVATVYDTVAMYLGMNTAGINNVYVEVWRKDSAGNIAQVSSQEVSASLTFTGVNAFYKEFALPSPIIANVGESYAVLARNATTNSVLLVTRTMRSEDPGPVLFTGADALKTSHTAVEVATAQTAAALSGTTVIVYPLPWAMLATANGVVDSKVYADDFNRVGIGSLWFPTSNTPPSNLGIVGNKVEYGGTAAGEQLQLYTKPVSTDQMLVEANLYGTNQTTPIGLMSCCNRELTQVVYLAVNGFSANIYTGAWNSLTQRASVTLNNVTPADAKWGLTNNPTTGVFTILKNGASVGTWTDTGGVVLHGENFRYGGVRIARNSAGFEGGTLDNFTLRDA